jgi:hypothetical protein
LRLAAIGLLAIIEHWSLRTIKTVHYNAKVA